ncbi:MAG: glycerophosphodiester phosphodiesterase [Erysipelothrix sp.]|nr:glycerophosphodiester phosphodiesterase [Erysipelothrix sp.]
MYGLAIFIIIVVMIFPTRKAKFQTRLFGHRGLYNQDQSIRENSIEAFQKAMSHDVGIELDVQLSKDNQVIVFHDDDLKRLFNIELKVSEMDAIELSHYGIPLFKEVLDLVDAKVALIVEIKPGENDKVLTTKVLELLKEYAGVYYVESFDPRIVYMVRQFDSSIIRGQLLMPAKKYKNLRTGIFLNSLLYNVLTRPDFIAVEVELYQKNPMIWLFSLLGGQQIVWTVHARDYRMTKNLPIIYEFFDARIRN